MALSPIPPTSVCSIIRPEFNERKSAMRRIFALAICSACLSSGALAADVGVSIQFSQPGVFGRVDIGQYPQPQLTVAQPTMVERLPPGAPPPEPVYLWVPLENRQHWEKHWHEYHACGHPVYFVNNEWYKNKRAGSRIKSRGAPRLGAWPLRGTSRPRSRVTLLGDPIRAA